MSPKWPLFCFLADCILFGRTKIRLLSPASKSCVMRSDDSRGTHLKGEQDSLNLLQYKYLVLLEVQRNLNKNSLF